MIKEISRKNPASALTDELTKEELQDLVDRAQEKALATPERTDRLIVEEAAEKYDIEPGFILLFNGKPYITKEGLLVQARRIGFRSIEAEIHPDDKGGYEAEGRVYRLLNPEEVELLRSLSRSPDAFLKVFHELGRPTVAHATANRDNVRLTEIRDKFLRELAETRAINRALRLFTGCGMVSVDELPDAGVKA